MDKKQNRYERDKSTPWIRRVFTWTIIVVFLMFCASVGFVGGTIYAFHDDLPSLAPLEDYNSAKWSLPTKVYSRDGQLIASFYEERRELVDIKNLPRELIQAVIAIEDSRFFQHNGVDFKGIARAAYKNFMAGRIVEGGSTLTQQLAKVLFFSPKQTFRRKIREALLAIKIERNYTKEQILDRYFNKVYFGEGAYGIETASQVYFGKSARNLNTAEAALLAALPKAPSYYSPLDNPKRARKRHRLVLKLMENKGMIEEGKAKKLFKKFWKSYSRQSHKLETRRKEQIRSAPYFSELIRKKLLNKYGADVVYRGGLTVRTTVNLDYQQHIQNQLYDYLLEFNKNKGNLSDTATKIPKDPDRALVEGSVAVKDPETGEMLAVVGGHEWHIKNQLNRAVQSHRQPGSAFKPILYAAALDSDYTISSSLQDRPLVFETPQGQWTPQNYSEEFHGRVTVHTALVNSLNVATIDLMQQIGPRKFIDYARKLGVESSLSPHMSLALGGVREGVTLEEIVGVYS
ncbi:MAG: transglycosylase domain-containing protein, partial [bacterium]